MQEVVAISCDLLDFFDGGVSGVWAARTKRIPGISMRR